MINKIILFEHAVETLGFFSHELASVFTRNNCQTFFIDYHKLDQSMKHVRKFISHGRTALFTFNFIGLSQESYCHGKDEKSIWETYDLPCFCVMVDHPIYYYEQLNRRIPNLVTFCIDRQHVEYVHRFYPDIPCYFLPLAGNVLPDAWEGMQRMQEKTEQKSAWDAYRRDWIPYEKRAYDVAFIGNRMMFPKMEDQLKSQTQEYIDFYYEILNDMKHHPDEPVDATMERFILREIPEATDAEIASAQHGMLFLELYIRAYFRDKVVKTLVDGGIRVHAFGKNWDQMHLGHPENLISEGRMITSKDCVEVVRNARVSLNVMPHFKDGAHDRIFTAMLNGAVSLTDPSIYLKEILTEGENTCFYELDRMMELPDRVHGILTNPESAIQIMEQAFSFASAFHTWENRAEILLSYIQEKS